MSWNLLLPARQPRTLQERSRLVSIAIVPIVLAGIVVPLSWRLIGQFLTHRGYTDLASAGPVHLAGAVSACVAAVLVGPRLNKYNRDGSSNAIPGHSVPLASIGF